GQGEDRLVVKKEPAVINEAAAMKPRNDGKIVELGADDFKQAGSAVVPTAGPAAVPAAPASTVVDTTTNQPAQAPALQASPVYAQLLVSADQKTAEALAATLIDKGFTTAYVERAGTTFKVRVKFNSESEARAAESKLKEFAKDVWIVK